MGGHTQGRGGPSPRWLALWEALSISIGKQQTRHLDAQEEEVTCQMGPAGPCQSRDSNPGLQAPEPES